MPDISNLDLLHPRTKKVVIEFYKIHARQPHAKKSAVVREVARTLHYKVDKRGWNSTVATIVKKWQGQ
jgi:hypothetical protein